MSSIVVLILLIANLALASETNYVLNINEKEYKNTKLSQYSGRNYINLASARYDTLIADFLDSVLSLGDKKINRYLESAFMSSYFDICFEINSVSGIWDAKTRTFPEYGALQITVTDGKQLFIYLEWKPYDEYYVDDSTAVLLSVANSDGGKLSYSSGHKSCNTNAVIDILNSYGWNVGNNATTSTPKPTNTPKATATPLITFTPEPIVTQALSTDLKSIEVSPINKVDYDGCILPQLKILFGAEIPNLDYILQRTPEAEVEQSDGSTMISYADVDEDELKLIDRYLTGCGGKLIEVESEDQNLYAVYTFKSEEVKLLYNLMDQSCTLYCPYFTYVGNEIGEIASQGQMASIEDLFGMALPAISSISNLVPEIRTYADKTYTEYYTEFGADEYSSWSSYLAATECQVLGYGVDGSVMNIVLQKDEKEFTFIYDNGENTATVIYGEGTRPEKFVPAKYNDFKVKTVEVTPTPTPSPKATATPKPTATLTPKATKKPTPTPTVKPVGMSQWVTETFNDQQIKLTGYNFHTKWYVTYGHTQHSWEAGWKQTYLIVSYDWQNASYDRIKAMDMIHPYVIYNGKEYTSVYYPVDGSEEPLFFGLKNISVKSGKKIQFQSAFELPEEAKTRGSLKIVFKDPKKEYSIVGEYVIR